MKSDEKKTCLLVLQCVSYYMQMEIYHFQTKKKHDLYRD